MRVSRTSEVATEGPHARPVSTKLAPKNLCSTCGVDYATLELFHKHRWNFKVVKEHSTQECWKLIETGKHPKGECQRLVGRCLAPEDLDLVEYHGYWYTPEGVEKAKALSERFSGPRKPPR